MRHFVGCCPNVEKSWHGRKVKLGGHYVLKGIRSFMGEIADAFVKSADAEFRKAKKLVDVESSDRQWLQEKLERAVGFTNNSKKRKQCSEALSHVDHSIMIEAEAQRLRRAPGLVIDPGAHGFVTNRKLESKAFFRDWTSKDPLILDDIFNIRTPQEMEPHFEPYEPAQLTSLKQDWNFSPQGTWDQWDRLSIDQRSWRLHLFQNDLDEDNSSTQASRQSFDEDRQFILNHCKRIPAPFQILQGDADPQLPSIGSVLYSAATKPQQ